MVKPNFSNVITWIGNSEKCDSHKNRIWPDKKGIVLNPPWNRESEQAVDCPRFNIYIVHQWENWTPYFYIMTDMCWNINFNGFKMGQESFNHADRLCNSLPYTRQWPVNCEFSDSVSPCYQYSSVTLIVRMQCGCVLHDGIERRIYVNWYSWYWLESKQKKKRTQHFEHFASSTKADLMLLKMDNSLGLCMTIYDIVSRTVLVQMCVEPVKAQTRHQQLSDWQKRG